MAVRASDTLVTVERNAEYDQHVSLPQACDVTAAQVLDWETTGSSSNYGSASNPTSRQGRPYPRSTRVWPGA